MNTKKIEQEVDEEMARIWTEMEPWEARVDAIQRAFDSGVKLKVRRELYTSEEIHDWLNERFDNLTATSGTYSDELCRIRESGNHWRLEWLFTPGAGPAGTTLTAQFIDHAVAEEFRQRFVCEDLH